MTTSKTLHLTDEQFTDFLMEQPVDPAAVAHLSACSRCQEEQRRFIATMEDFNGASLAWMESKPIRDVVPAGRRPFRVPQWAPAGFAFAAVAVGALSFTAERYLKPHPEQVAAVHTVSAPADSAAQIASDNRLLQDVAIALSTEYEPLKDFHIPPGHSFVPGHHLKSRTK